MGFQVFPSKTTVDAILLPNYLILSFNMLFAPEEPNLYWFIQSVPVQFLPPHSGIIFQIRHYGTSIYVGSTSDVTGAGV